MPIDRKPRMVFIVMVCLLVVALFLAVVFVRTAPSDVIDNDWDRYSSASSDILRHYKPLAEGKGDLQAISACKTVLVSTGRVRWRFQAQLNQVLEGEGPDGRKITVYVFSERGVFGPSWFLWVDKANRKIIKKEWMPDA